MRIVCKDAIDVRLLEYDENSADQTDARPVGTVGDQDGGGDKVDAGPTRYSVAMDLSEDHDSKDVYRMNFPQRGLAVIINNKKFDSRINMPERHGTDVDAAGLYQVFKDFDFEVRLVHNQTKREIREILDQASKYNHSNSDCFVCAILTHGEEGLIYATDGKVPITDIVDPFKGNNCAALIGKPKLFFIQACRGTQLDHGVDQADTPGEEVDMDEVDAVTVHRIPSEADFLMAYSVVPGYFAWRNSSNGSWFCQALCDVFKRYGKQLDILTLMTRVNKKVAYEFESNASKANMSNKKQIPCITSMLTKDLYFRPKK